MQNEIKIDKSTNQENIFDVIFNRFRQECSPLDKFKPKHQNKFYYERIAELIKNSKTPTQIPQASFGESHAVQLLDLIENMIQHRNSITKGFVEQTNFARYSLFPTINLLLFQGELNPYHPHSAISKMSHDFFSKYPQIFDKPGIIGEFLKIPIQSNPYQIVIRNLTLCAIETGKTDELLESIKTSYKTNPHKTNSERIIINTLESLKLLSVISPSSIRNNLQQFDEIVSKMTEFMTDPRMTKCFSKNIDHKKKLSMISHLKQLLAFLSDEKRITLEPKLTQAQNEISRSYEHQASYTKILQDYRQIETRQTHLKNLI